MNEKYYIVFDGNGVIGIDKGVLEGNSAFQSYWLFDEHDAASTWFEAEFLFKRDQIIKLLEFLQEINGKNVYEFSGDADELLDMLQSNTANAISELNNIGDYSNAKLIEKLRNEEDNFAMTEDAVKRPSHYMLEDGTEVKNHIRSILGDDGFKSWAIGNAIKYVSRYKDKGKPIQDLKKAQENIQMVIDVLGEQDDLD